MKGVMFFSCLSMLAVSSAFAQSSGTQFYVDWDNAAKKCIVVTAKPADKNIEGGGPFISRAAAEAAFKKVKGCQG